MVRAACASSIRETSKLHDAVLGVISARRGSPPVERDQNHHEVSGRSSGVNNLEDNGVDPKLANGEHLQPWTTSLGTGGFRFGMLVWRE